MARNQRPQPTAEDKKNVRVGCGIMLAALLAVGGCGALINDDNASSSKVSSPTAASPDTSSSSASSSLSTFDDKPNTVTVDDFVGMGLQAAQDAAQDDGLYRLDSTDATGQGRQQVWDRNWTVCAQTPAAGETMSADDTLTFDTVKSSEGETCDDPTGSAGSEDSSTSGTGDSSTVAGTGDDQTDGSSDSGSSSLTGGSDSSGDESSSSASSAGSPQAPAGATAQCNDGSYSYSAHRRGTCSHHRGVAVWLASVPS
ncbi:DUF3761 domain-containing protein [Streptomyces bugieae]|uniref:DUF3761 domain-containing protein n=1 Tax=Streptomyces bugieae TaxID=3098223 RepID=A0ABU7NHJ0_9ACTN|nr:DUF3761 domain-containing protein [Streptomyces sp. DSM 41528]